MESSQSIAESYVLVILLIAAVALILVTWLLPEKSQEMLDFVINDRFGTSFRLPFGVKDRYNIRGS